MNHPRFSPGWTALTLALFCLLLASNLACQGQEQTFARRSEAPGQGLTQARDAARNSEAAPVTSLETRILNRGLGFMGLDSLASPSEARALEERGFQRASDRPGTRPARTDPGAPVAPPLGGAGQTTVNVTVGDPTVTLDLQTEPDSSSGGLFGITLVSGYQATLPQGSSMTLVYEVMQQGTSTPAPDATVIRLRAQTQGGSTTTAQWLLVATRQVSGGQGRVAFNFSGQSGSTLDGNRYLDRRVILKAEAGNGDESLPSDEIAVGVIPAGTGGSYLTGVAGANMNWSNANAYCASHGGRLPRINNADSQTWDQIAAPGTAFIDSVGTINTSSWNTPWANTGLPGYGYWTGTVSADYPGGSWTLDAGVGNGGVVHVYNYGLSIADRVVCVP